MSGCMSFAVMIIIFLVVTSGIPLPFRSRDRARPWRRLARQYNGVFTGIGLFTSPMLRFRYGSARASLTANRREAKFTISWPDPETQCDLISRSDHGRPAVSRLPELQTGDRDFDWSYRVHAGDQQAATGLLTAHVRAELQRVAKQNGGGRVLVSFRPGQLTIVKQAKLSTYDQLVLFMRACTSLYDQALLTRAEGIDFCEDDDFRPLDEVKCQVCGEDIGEELVFCARCRTPHHQECWEYYGSCTVYGCQETDFERPRVAMLLSSHVADKESDEGAEGAEDAVDAERDEATEASEPSQEQPRPLPQRPIVPEDIGSDSQTAPDERSRNVELE